MADPPESPDELDQPPSSLLPPRETIVPSALTTPEIALPATSTSGAFPSYSGSPSSTFPLRSLPPLPEVQPILDQAAELREKKDWDGALEAYKKALFVVPQDAVITQASIYASVAEVKALQGKDREAEASYEKALLINPKHLRAIDGLVALANQTKDWPRLAAARRRRAEAIDDPEDKASELCVVAEIEETKLKDVEKALATLEIASVHRPDDIGILLKLRDFYTLTRSWPKLLDVLDDLVRVSSEPSYRGAFRFAQADIMLGRLREEPRGLAFLELALDEDPQCDRALSALVAVRTRREEWAELANVYERLVDRYAGIGDSDRAWEVCRKLGTLRRDRLLDGPGAIDALTGAVELRPEDVESRAALAELHFAKGERAAAVRELETAAMIAPLRAQTYRRLFELHQRAGRLDRAWLCATCLEELGASDVAQELVIEQFRPDGAIRPTAAHAESAWNELLVAQGADPIVDGILRVIGDLAITLRLEQLEAQKKLPMLDPLMKQDKESTASAIRTFTWAARALGLEAPDLYALPTVPNGIAALQAAAPSTALGPQVLSGRTIQQLAFAAGRHLAYYRPEYYPLVFFPTLAELSALVLSAVRLVIPGISVPPPPEGEVRIGAELGPRLGSEQKEELKEIVARLDARGGKLDLFAWIRSVELTATRAGMLLVGDLRVATRILKEERRAIGELTEEAKRSDLLAFTASEEYGILRERMGIAIHPAALSSSGLKTAGP
jgi:tetratricopeptide (TPR) repeat protein